MVPGELSARQVAGVMQGETCETISCAGTHCIDQVAVDMRASAVAALALQHTLPQQIGLCVCINLIG
jgi:nucleoside phosphorylase